MFSYVHMGDKKDLLSLEKHWKSLPRFILGNIVCIILILGIIVIDTLQVKVSFVFYVITQSWQILFRSNE